MMTFNNRKKYGLFFIVISRVIEIAELKIKLEI
jgi:hypothetical protein